MIEIQINGARERGGERVREREREREREEEREECTRTSITII